MRLKIVDGFVWFIVTGQAKEIFKSELFELYALYDDGSEGLIDTEESLNKALKNGLKIGIEGGFINTLILRP
jgi:hypothetical protein